MENHNHKTIIDMFHFWKNLTYPGGLMDKDGEQYKQLRFAFFAGASSMLIEMIAEATAPETQEEGAVSRYGKELDGFFDSIKEEAR
jgi:hypothetical protein